MLKEKGRLDLSSKDEKEYKLPFSITDLKQSLQRVAKRQRLGHWYGLLLVRGRLCSVQAQQVDEQSGKGYVAVR